MSKPRSSILFIGAACAICALIFYQVYLTVFVNISNLLAVQGIMNNNPVKLAQARLALAQVEPRDEPNTQIMGAQLRLCVFAQNWTCAQRYVGGIDSIGIGRDILIAWLTRFSSVIETVSRNGASADLTEFIQAAFKKSQGHWVLGNIYERAARPAEAKEQYKLVFGQDGDQSLEAAACLRIGIINENIKNWEEAVLYLKKAIEIGPSLRVQAYGWMNRPLVELGRRAEAVENNLVLLKEANSRHWQHVFLMGLGYLFGRQDCTPCDFDKAYEYFRRARDVAPSEEQRNESILWMMRAANRQDH